MLLIGVQIIICFLLTKKKVEAYYDLDTDQEHAASAWMKFFIVRSHSPYNEIIGRPGMRKIQAVPSTVHGMLKFPVEGEVLTLQSSKIIPLECAMVSEPAVETPVADPLAEERIKVAIHPEHPDQTVAIGSAITEEAEQSYVNYYEKIWMCSHGVRQI